MLGVWPEGAWPEGCRLGTKRTLHVGAARGALPNVPFIRLISSWVEHVDLTTMYGCLHLGASITEAINSTHAFLLKRLASTNIQ
jgi:hypothetical protein